MRFLGFLASQMIFISPSSKTPFSSRKAPFPSARLLPEKTPSPRLFFARSAHLFHLCYIKLTKLSLLLHVPARPFTMKTTLGKAPFGLPRVARTSVGIQTSAILVSGEVNGFETHYLEKTFRFRQSRPRHCAPSLRRHGASGRGL